MLKMEFKFKYTISSQFISVKAKKNLRKSQAQFREKLRKLRLRQNNNFLIKKRVSEGPHFAIGNPQRCGVKYERGLKYLISSARCYEKEDRCQRFVPWKISKTISFRF